MKPEENAGQDMDYESQAIILSVYALQFPLQATHAIPHFMHINDLLRPEELRKNLTCIFQSIVLITICGYFRFQKSSISTFFSFLKEEFVFYYSLIGY